MFVFSLAFILFFFFKQKTAYEMRISDWSSDVCSSDLSASWLLPPSRSFWCKDRTAFPAVRYRCGTAVRYRCAPALRRCARELLADRQAFSLGHTGHRLWMVNAPLAPQIFLQHTGLGRPCSYCLWP